MSERPLSPHLQIYRPQITSITSILHRVSGVVQVFGFMVLCIGLICFRVGEGAYTGFIDIMTTKLGWLFLFGWSAAFFYHLSTGIRHFVFDAGFLFPKKQAEISGYVVIVAAAVMTIAFWVCVAGGPSQ